MEVVGGSLVWLDVRPGEGTLSDRAWMDPGELGSHRETQPQVTDLCLLFCFVFFTPFMARSTDYASVYICLLFLTSAYMFFIFILTSSFYRNRLKGHANKHSESDDTSAEIESSFCV